MPEFLRFKKFLFFLALLALIALVLSLFPRRNYPKVVSSDPVQNGVKFSVYDAPTLTFDRPINLSDITLSSTPSEDWELTQNTTDSITLNHKLYLQVSAQYQVDVFYQKKLIHTLSFTTKPEQNDPRYLQGVQAGMDRDYPLAVKLPYNAPGFRLTYSAPLTIEIALKNDNITSAEAISYAEAWVKDQGFSISSHKYIVSEAPASPSPTPLRPTATPIPTLTPTDNPLEIDWDNLVDDGEE